MPAFPHFHLVFGIADIDVTELVTIDKETKLERSEPIIVDGRFTSLSEGWQDNRPPELVTSKRLTSFSEKEEIIARIINNNISDKTYGELLRWKDNVFGLRVDKVTLGSEIVMGLATLHPEYLQDGYIVIPQTELKDDDSKHADKLRKLIEHKKRRKKPGLSLQTTKPVAAEANYKKKLLKRGWNYRYFNIGILDYADVFCYLCRCLDLDIKKEEMRLILQWEWKGQRSIDG